MKATHDGTCQVCGSFQKLPGNVLSKHGYTKEWGFFNGVCWGAGHKPFEVSKDLIEQAIARATENLEETRKESAELKAGKLAEGNKAFAHVYHESMSRRTRSGYSWDLVTVLAEDKTSTSDPDFKWTKYYYETENARRQRMEAHEIHNGYYGEHSEPHSLDTVRVSMNVKYAESVLDKRASQLVDYINWQRERIKDWKPTALKARAD